MKKLILLGFLIILSCNSKESTIYEEMKSDKLMSDFFTKSELENLAKIVNFFESEIFRKIEVKNINEKYNNFLKLDSIRYVVKNEMYTFNYESQKELYTSLDTTFFKTFWGKGVGTKYLRNRKEITQEYFNLKVYEENGLSKYLQFIKKYTIQNKVLKEYIKSIELSNEFFTPSTPIHLTIHYSKYDKEDIIMRLIYAFHYLNVNEYYKYN